MIVLHQQEVCRRAFQKSEKKVKLPTPIVDFLAEREKKSHSPCSQCNASCCNGPGFALLENILEIYQKDVSGSLMRSDYNFISGLTLSQFIFRYFDRTVINGRLLVFFPK